MTTAHRPTFDPARGKDANRGPAYHQRLLPAHKTLKFRQANQGTEAETSRRDLRTELLRAERRAQAKKEGREYASDDEEGDVPFNDEKLIADATQAELESGVVAGRKRSVDEAEIDGGEGGAESYEAKRARVLAETKGLDASSDEEGEDDADGEKDDDDEDESSEEDEDDEDEEALLMAELAKIKRERAEAAAKEAAEQAKRDEESREKQIAYGNPLLDPRSGGQDYGVKRRWDDDVVFKNQARGYGEREEKAKGKEFVNDLLRSDFHKKFMNRYVR